MKIFFCFFLIIYMNIVASVITFEENNDKPVWFCADSHKNSTSLEFSLSGFELLEVHQKDQQYYQIPFENEGRLLEIGNPDLPQFSTLIALPETGMPEITITYQDMEIFENIKIYPYQDAENSKNSTSDFLVNSQIYEQDTPFPQKIAEISQPAIMRNYRIATVTLKPFQFIPTKNQLIVYKNISVTINIENKESINEMKIHLKKSPAFENLYKNTIINYDLISKEDEEYQQPCYLFISPDNSTVEQNLETLLDWKRKKGFEVHYANTTETGSSASNIKSYIQNAYNTWSNPPEFICLVGDAGGSYNIPTGSYSGGEGDQYYTLLDGSDILADAFIGRLACSSELQLRTIINKILRYEKTPYIDSNWFDNILLVGDPSSSGQSTIITSKYIKEMMKSQNTNFNFAEIYSGSFVNNIANNINSGVSYYNYRGWLGMSGWDISDTNALNNGYMLPVVVIITCGTGDFENYEADSEAFLKAGTPSVPKGAIASIGTATMSTHTTFNNCVDAGIFSGIFIDEIYNMGGALVHGKLNLFRNFPQNPNNWVNKFSYWNNLMGDPGMDVWTSLPQELNVNYAENIGLGSNFLEVTVLNNDNSPVPNAWVTALKGDYELFASGYTDINGKIFLELTENVSGTIDLTVTKHDHIPHIGNFTIGESDFLANFVSFEIDDDNLGDSNGNGDGLINPGEEIELNFELKNLGIQNISNVIATITTNSDFILITDNMADFGDISSGQTVNPSEQFIFQVDQSALGNSIFQFVLHIEDDNGHCWNDPVNLSVIGAAVYASDYNIIDGNDGILDPGEETDLTITLQNIGAVNADNITATLRCNSSSISIIDSMAIYGEIPANDETINESDHFTISASSSVLPGSQIPFKLIISDINGFLFEDEIIINIGTVTVNDPLGQDSYGYYCYDSGDTGYELAPVYDWIEIAPNFGGPGTAISMSDNGDDGAIANIDLPFNLVFYGNVYTSITICSNGWISPGTTSQYSYMNWHIPGPLGPSPMIAPFWDDLVISGGQVCYYYDESAHYFVVEWSHLKNDYNTNYEETFQVIIFDPAHYLTFTGDADILFQYKTINNINVGTYYSYSIQHGQYATIGLEDHTGTVGLEYTFNNSYPIAARTISNNMALLFTTNVGHILEPPVANISPSIFNFAVLEHQTQQNTLTISNFGQANLWYSISKNYIDSESAGKDHGGPDNYGYQWFDSDEPEIITYDWREISSVGTQVTFTHNDHATEMIPLEFDFNFYGTNYNEFRINPNGWIGFADDNIEWINLSIPSSIAPKAAIMPYWDDLNPLTGGAVYYYSTPDSLVVEFDNVMHYAAQHNGIYSFEVILYPNGNILYQYRSVTGDIDTATIGIQNADASDALQIVYNSNYIHDEMAILIKHVIDWVELSDVSGSVFSGNSTNIQVQVDSEELNIGNYLCELIITTNDPDMSLITIPINLQVLVSMCDIDVNETSFDFGDIYLNEPVVRELIVTNVGTDPLYISDIVFNNEDFSVNIDDFSLLENEDQAVIISFQPTETGQIEAEMTIFSNDPDEQELNISFLANVLATGSEDDINTVRTELKGNYPNPFNPETTISFSLSAKDVKNAKIEIYNIKGQKVKTFSNLQINKLPNQQIFWNGTNEVGKPVSSGIYFYRLKTDNFDRTKKMIMIK